MSSTRLQSYQIQLKKAMGKDMAHSLDLLEKHIDPSSRKHSELILQLSRYNGAQREKRQGLMTGEQSNLVFNQIRAAVMYFIEDLEEADINWGEVKEGEIEVKSPQEMIEVTQPVSSSLSETQRKGLLRQQKLIEEKLSFLEEQLLLAVAPDAKFSISKQIEDLDQQLIQVNEKLEK